MDYRVTGGIAMILLIVGLCLALIVYLFSDWRDEKRMFREDYEEYKRRDAEMEAKWAKINALKSQGLSDDEFDEAVWRIRHGGEDYADTERRKDTKL